MKLIKYLLLTAVFPLSMNIQAEDELELDTTFIKGNKELPQMMYVVPWQDMKTNSGQKAAQNLSLHSLFGDIFDPVLPDDGIFIDQSIRK